MNDLILRRLATGSCDMSGTLRGHQSVVGSLTAATTLSEADSGAVYQINVGSNAAADITLPAITADNVGMCFEFHLGTSNSEALRIVTADADNTTGDNFTGGLLNITNVANGPTTNAVQHVVPGADSSAILLDEDATNAKVQVGTYIKCVALSFSSDAHSLWLVSGYAITDGNDSTGAGIFVNI